MAKPLFQASSPGGALDAINQRRERAIGFGTGGLHCRITGEVSNTWVLVIIMVPFGVP